jgi:DNA-binding response OmpR family regulator
MLHRPAPSLPHVSQLLAGAARAIAPRRVLVTGPDERMRLVLASVLRSRGYDVVHAGSDSVALDYIAQSLSSPPWTEGLDAIVLDARDDLRTLELFARLREQDWATPVVVVVSRDDVDARDEARRLGAAVTLPMPLKPEELASALLSIVPPL